MIKKPFITALIAGILNTGCSIMGARFPDLQLPNQNIDIETTKVMLYNFITPRREPAPQNFNAEPKASTRSNHQTYFSASGYECRVVPSGYSRPLCFINGTWQETAAIFNSKAL